MFESVASYCKKRTALLKGCLKMLGTCVVKTILPWKTETLCRLLEEITILQDPVLRYINQNWDFF